MYSSFGQLMAAVQKHKVFLSYYHRDDQRYKDTFERTYGRLFINKSVREGDIATDRSTEYIKRLIQSEDYIRDASVVIVFCGPNTKKRKHVDWEIYSGLSQKVGGRSGLIGILLPEFLLLPDGTYYYSDLPPRLSDNVLSGFAKIYTWNSLIDNPQGAREIINTAFSMRTRDNLVDNSRGQMKMNLP